MPNTQVTLAYTVTVQPTANIAHLSALLAAIPVNLDLLPTLGTHRVSDVTTTALQTATRTFVISFFATTKSFPLTDPEVAPFRGSVVSSNPNDTLGGSGLQVLTISFVNTNGQPQQERVELKGTTPVNLVLQGKVSVTSFTPTLGTPQGLVVLTSGPNATGDRVAVLPGNFTGTLVSTSPEDAAGKSGATSVDITYHDKLGAGPFTITVIPTGTTPLVLPVSNIAFINAITPNHPNIGILTVSTGDTVTVSGAPAILQPSGFQAYFPDTSDQRAPWWDLFTHILTQGLGSPLAVADPVLA